MASQTFLGRDMFAAFWGLVVVGFLASRRPVNFPAGEALRRFVEAREGGLHYLLSAVEASCSLDAAVMKVAIDEAPWAPGTELDEESTCSDVSLMVGRLVDVDDLRGAGLDALLAEAADNLVERFVEALLAAIFSFGDRSRGPEAASREVLEALAAFLDEASIPGRAVKTGFARWSERRLPAVVGDAASDADYRAWLRKH
jgi:hypothetical protein